MLYGSFTLKRVTGQLPRNLKYFSQAKFVCIKPYYCLKRNTYLPQTPLPVSPPEEYINRIHEEDDENLLPLSPLVRNEEIDFEDELWEEEGKMLFEWTQNLSFSNDAS